MSVSRNANGIPSAAGEVLVAVFGKPCCVSNSERYNHDESSYSRETISRSNKKLPERPTCSNLNHHSSSLDAVAYDCNFASL